MKSELKYDQSRPLRRLESGDEAVISVTHFPRAIVRVKDVQKYGHIPNGTYKAFVTKPYYLECPEYPALNGNYNYWRGDKHGCSDGIYAKEKE